MERNLSNKQIHPDPAGGTVKKKLGDGQKFVAIFAVIAAGLTVYNSHVPSMLALPSMIGWFLWLIVVLGYLFFLFHDVKRYALITPTLLAVSIFCAWKGPYLGFLISQKPLEALAQSTLASQRAKQSSSGDFNPPSKAGVYDVLAYSVDVNNGTVYLVTRYENDGIGPDTCTSGFVYKPVATASPYGSKYYAPSQLVGDWYQFSASNDY